MFKPHRFVFIAIPLFLLAIPLIFSQTTSQSLPQAKLFAEGVMVDGPSRSNGKIK